MASDPICIVCMNEIQRRDVKEALGSMADQCHFAIIGEALGGRRFRKIIMFGNPYLTSSNVEIRCVDEWINNLRTKSREPDGRAICL